MPTTRFGPRYGRKPKSKLKRVEVELKKKHKCPYCNKLGVKRLAAGIWNCPKCNAKFAGKAYTI
ncbi:50S ribosomal protein L37ae [Candidatus Woesearchaeota archaeon CG_4_10_14_0_2_um_filter_33_13]|nr:MAG: 50S ribosomal protein L37ae [Candidatus Woesearchaeota archaeon CG_4_10_14_0_2_um_filter_33_13]